MHRKIPELFFPSLALFPNSVHSRLHLCSAFSLMSSLHFKARAISYLGLSSTDLPGDLAISWTLSIIDWEVQIPNNLFYNNVVPARKAAAAELSVFSVGGSSGVAESKDLDSDRPELKLCLPSMCPWGGPSLSIFYSL